MKKFIVIYHSTPEANKEMAAATPKQQAKGMDAWMKWGAKCGAQLVDMGAPLVGGLAVALDGTSKKKAERMFQVILSSRPTAWTKQKNCLKVTHT